MQPVDVEGAELWEVADPRELLDHAASAQCFQ